VPPKKSPTLTEAELRLMEVLWQVGPATVHQVLEALPAKLPLAYNSVLTTIRILEKKGLRAARERRPGTRLCATGRETGSHAI